MSGVTGTSIIVGQHPRARAQIGAGVEYRFRREAEARKIRAIDLHQPRIEISAASKKPPGRCDRIGRIGLEAAFESHLRGAWGGQMVEVNAMGEIQRILGDRPSKAGKDLQTTLDLDLQRAAEQVLKDKPGGAIVALNPANGAILALATP